MARDIPERPAVRFYPVLPKTLRTTTSLAYATELIAASGTTSTIFYKRGKPNMAKKQSSSLDKPSIDETLEQLDTDAERGVTEASHCASIMRNSDPCTSQFRCCSS